MLLTSKNPSRLRVHLLLFLIKNRQSFYQNYVLNKKLTINQESTNARPETIQLNIGIYFKTVCQRLLKDYQYNCTRLIRLYCAFAHIYTFDKIYTIFAR